MPSKHKKREAPHRLLAALALSRGYDGIGSLAEGAGISKRAVFYTLRGRRDRRTIRALASALDISPAELCDLLGAAA